MLSPPHKLYQLFFKWSNAWSQRTTKVGPEVFVVSHGEVLKSREGCSVAAVQVSCVTQGAPPGDTNRYCYVWLGMLGTSGVQLRLPFQLVLQQENKLHKMLIKSK